MSAPPIFVLPAEQAHQRSAAAAARLASRGLRPGDRIALNAPSPTLPAETAARTQAAVACAAFGALRMGIIPVMVNPALSAEEQQLYLTDADVAMHLHAPEQLWELGEPGVAHLGADMADVPLGRPMHFTSGTTGRSKGVWAGVLDEASASRYWADEHSAWPLDGSDVVLNHGPLAHSAPLRFSFLAFLHGATMVYTGPFDAATTAQAMAATEPSVAMAVPTHLQRLLDLPGGPPASPYRMLIHAGAPCPPDLKSRIHRWAGAENVWEFLGSTEGQFTTCNGLQWEERPGTLGQARPGRRLLIGGEAPPLGGTGTAAPSRSSAPLAVSAPGEPGVIWCEAPEFARFEYFRDAEKSSGACQPTPAGVRFSVGDLGYLDNDGYLFLKGRRTDLIITGGVNVYPSEVEVELRNCPGVEDAAVYGVPDATWGERVCAAVVGSMRASDVHAWAAGHMAGYRRPKSITVVPELPLTSNGKVRREGLAQWVERAGQD